MISISGFGRERRIMAAVTGTVMVSTVLVAAASVRDDDAVPTLTAATGTPSEHGTGLAAFLVANPSISGTRGWNGNSLQDLPPPPQPEDIEILRTARTLRCAFDDVSSDILIDGVNHGTGFGEARLVGNVGASDVLSVRGRSIVSFIEFLPNAVNTVTVYASKDNEQRFVAVYSRHTVVFGVPTPSQQRGSCQVLG